MGMLRKIGIELCNFSVRADGVAGLFLGVLFSYRAQQKYLLHGFALMADHFHLRILLALGLEPAMLGFN